ncbi:MAG: D-alanine--D-alanine ligase family protein [Thermovirgaceae bacterium]
MIQVDVICGGDSPEREVSLASGAAVCEALLEAGLGARKLEVTSREDTLQKVLESSADVFFIALHGGWGEDGRLQAALEFFGRVYTGSGPKACACAMDKTISKALFLQAGVPTPPSVFFHEGRQNLPQAEIRKLFDSWGKLVVKPAGCGSTVGVSIIDDPACFTEAFEEALAYDESVVVEKYIPGKEITVTVWQENDVPRALPAVEIRPKRGFYTYEAKYVPGATEYFCPATMQKKTASAVAEAALAAHSALDCRIYSRVDLRLSPEGHPFVLEVNTAPGMTATSLVPKAAAASGWTFADLCGRIVTASLAVAKRGAPLS